MNRDKSWQKLEDYIASRLKEIDPYCRHSKASGGNCGENHDIKTSCELAIECKLRNTESIKIDKVVWEKLCSEIPLHAHKTPMLALENKEGKRWAVLELDDFINLYIEYWKLKNERATA